MTVANRTHTAFATGTVAKAPLATVSVPRVPLTTRVAKAPLAAAGRVPRMPLATLGVPNVPLVALAQEP